MTAATAQSLSLENFKSYRDTGFLVVDTRSPQEFAEGFVPGAISIPFDNNFSDLVETLILSDRGLILVSHEGPAEAEALKALGFSNIAGYLEGGMHTWLEAGEAPDMVISIGSHEFSLDFKHDDSLTVYDLRPALGFQQEHLKNATNKSVEGLLNEISDFPTNKTYYLMCYDGALSMGVNALLKARGYHNFYHIAGGFKAVREEEKIELIAPNGKPNQGS